MRHATAIKLDAERKLGAILAVTTKATGGDAQRTRYSKGTESPPTLAALGLDKKTSARAQRLAALSDEAFEAVRSGDVKPTEALRRAQARRDPRGDDEGYGRTAVSGYRYSRGTGRRSPDAGRPRDRQEDQRAGAAAGGVGQSWDTATKKTRQQPTRANA